LDNTKPNPTGTEVLTPLKNQSNECVILVINRTAKNSGENVTNATTEKEMIKYTKLKFEINNKFKVGRSENFAGGSLSNRTNT
jgi:hypothetical protein